MESEKEIDYVKAKTEITKILDTYDAKRSKAPVMDANKYNEFASQLSTLFSPSLKLKQIKTSDKNDKRQELTTDLLLDTLNKINNELTITEFLTEDPEVKKTGRSTLQGVSSLLKFKNLATDKSQPKALQIHILINNINNAINELETREKHYDQDGIKKSHYDHLIDHIQPAIKSFRDIKPFLSVFEKNAAVKDSKELLTSRIVELDDQQEALGTSDPQKIAKIELKQFAECLDKLEPVLNINRQSKTEIALKILSIVAILALVGIVTTAYMVHKRHKASSGHSWNIFKPLSEDARDASAKKLGDVGIPLPSKKK